jgi:hypothetical protein
MPLLQQKMTVYERLCEVASCGRCDPSLLNVVMPTCLPRSRSCVLSQVAQAVFFAIVTSAGFDRKEL